MDELKKIIAGNISELRKNEGLTQAELAQAVMDRIMSRDRITDTSFFILRSTFLFAFSHF